jgi:hypothetical protein
VKTIGSVMNGPPSSGQHFKIGISSSVPPSFTTSWHGPLLTVLGIRSFRRPSIGSIFRGVEHPGRHLRVGQFGDLVREVVQRLHAEAPCTSASSTHTD